MSSSFPTPQDPRPDDDAPDPLAPEVTPGGSHVIRHEPGSGAGEHEGGGDTTFLSDDEMDAFQEFIEEHVGPIANVWHELISDVLHIDLLPVEPDAAERPFFFLCTMGMSALPMTVPEDYDGSPFAELCIALPPDWKRTSEDFDREGDDAYWPFGWLKHLARIPAAYDTFLAPGHTIPNEDPPVPFSERTPFVGMLVLPAEMLLEDLPPADLGEKQVELLMIFPLRAEEMDFKLEHGTEALLERFEELGLAPWEMCDPERPSACAKE